MAFYKGMPRHPDAGRKKGTPNKAATSIMETCDQLGCDPIAGMIALAQDISNTPELRGKMYAELAQYMYPKRKALEHSGPGGEPLTVIVRSVLQKPEGM